MTHGYNTHLLNYDITAADGTVNCGARTLAEMGNKIIKRLRKAFNFA